MYMIFRLYEILICIIALPLFVFLYTLGIVLGVCKGFFWIGYKGLSEDDIAELKGIFK